MRACLLIVVQLGILLLVEVHFVQAEHANPADVNLQHIIQTIKEQQAKVKTVRIPFSKEVLYPKGSFSHPSHPLDAKARTGVWPKEDLLKEAGGTILIDGQKIRRDEKDAFWSWEKERLVPDQESIAFVEGVSRRFASYETERNGLVQPRCPLLLADAFYPVRAAYRLFDPVLGPLKPEELRIVGRAEWDGHPCVIVENDWQELARQIDRGPIRWRIWLAEDQDYSVVRWEAVQPDGGLAGLTWQANMRYEKDEKGSWRLISFDVINRRDGKLTSKASHTSTDTRINEPIDPEEFELTFPPGTRVYDAIAETEYLVGEGPEIAVADLLDQHAADKVALEPQEKAAARRVSRPIEEVTAPEVRGAPAEAAPARWAFLRWLIVLVCAAAVVLAVLIVLRRWEE